MVYINTTIGVDIEQWELHPLVSLWIVIWSYAIQR